MKNIQCPSLLYPPDTGAPAGGHPAPNEADLGLGAIVRALDIDGRHSRFIAGVLAQLCADPLVIGYRQDVLADLLEHSELAARFALVLPQLGQLANLGRGNRWGDNL